MGRHLRVELLTMGPGTETYSRFGHSALRITDLRGVGDIVFNFGTFDQDDPKVISKFLAGDLSYWLSVSTYSETRAEYRSEGRLMVGQQLRLSPLQRRRLFLRLYSMARPGRREYRYHHFRANCSTRIRDLLDGVLGGELRRQLAARPAGTYRTWLRRATRSAPAFHLAFDLVLARADRRISAWEACFIPEQLMRALASVRLRGASRGEPLVVRTRILLPGPGFDHEPPAEPWTWVVLLSGLLLALAVIPVGLRPASPWPWRACGALVALWGLGSSVLSALLIYIWSISTLRVFGGNQNLLLLPPTQALWIPVGILLALRPPPRWRPPGWLLGLLAAQGCLAVAYGAAHGLGLVHQGNAPVVLASLPWSVVGVWILHRARCVPTSD